MNPIHIEVVNEVPPEVRALIWNEFFKSRGRGISLDFHSPWINTKAELYSVLAFNAEGSRIVGALVVRLYADMYGKKLGLIGYVCVDSPFRGQRISHDMVDKAISIGRELDLDAMLLWTQTPNVYYRNGFVAHDTDRLLQYEGNAGTQIDIIFGEEEWPSCEQNKRGLPAFALSARRISSSQASIILLETIEGCSIAEWSGPAKEVMQIIVNVTPQPWWINALADDPILTELDQTRIKLLDQRPSAAMICPLKDMNAISVRGVPLLDRI